jgi:hypothetical protein
VRLSSLAFQFNKRLRAAQSAITETQQSVVGAAYFAFERASIEKSSEFSGTL